jgi:hypothetical protein
MGGTNIDSQPSGLCNHKGDSEGNRSGLIADELKFGSDTFK